MNPKKLRLLMFGTSLTVALGVGPVQASKIKNESISGGEAAYLNSRQTLQMWIMSCNVNICCYLEHSV